MLDGLAAQHLVDRIEEEDWIDRSVIRAVELGSIESLVVRREGKL